MKLIDYINSFPLGLRKEAIEGIAKSQKVSSVTVRAWASGSRRATPQHALGVEEYLKGKVTRSDLRPDVYPTPKTKKLSS